MRIGLLRFGMLALALALADCASSGGAAVTDSYWRTEIGRVSPSMLQGAIDKVFRKHAIVLRRSQFQSGAREIWFETEWTSRQIMATEEGVGVTAARNRLVLRGYRLEAQWDGDSVYRLVWQLENEVTSAASPDWHPAPLPDEVRDRYRPVLSDLELELRSGLR